MGRAGGEILGGEGKGEGRGEGCAQEDKGDRWYGHLFCEVRVRGGRLSIEGSDSGYWRRCGGRGR